MDIEVNDAPIDDLMLDTIMTLNKKGYKTSYSCQGHADKHGESNAYVMFNDLHILDKIKNYKKVRLPKGYKYDAVDVIRAFFKGTIEEQEEQIISSSKALKRWADRLPDIQELY